jgi:hypothetical protein
MPRLLLDPSRRPGAYARSLAEAARREWFESRCGDDVDTEQGRARSDALWASFRRAESGALAEETVGRFLALLPSWLPNTEVIHGVEFRGLGLPRGDIDHLVVVRDLSFALAVETKFRLYDDEIPDHRERIKERAAAAEEVTGWWTYPALCQAAAAVTDRDDEWVIERQFADHGSVLLADALNITTAIAWIVTEFETFRKGGEPIFPEHR